MTAARLVSRLLTKCPTLHLPFPTKGPTLGSRAEQESRNRSLYGDDYYSLSVYLRGCYPRTLSTRSVTTRLPSSRPPYRSSSHPPLLRHMSAWRAAPERAPGNSLCPFQEARAPLGAARCLMAHGSRMVLGTVTFSAASIPPRCCHDKCLSMCTYVLASTRTHMSFHCTGCPAGGGAAGRDRGGEVGVRGGV